MGGDEGRADLRDQNLAELFLVVLERLMQLIHALDAEFDVGRPRGRVERTTRSGNSGFGFVDAGVRSMSVELTGRRVVGREGLVERDQFTVDEQGLRHARR